MADGPIRNFLSLSLALSFCPQTSRSFLLLVVGNIQSPLQVAIDKWREYFEQISTEESAHPTLSQALLTFGPILPEVEDANV